MPLNPILFIEIFDCWVIDFMGPFPPSFGFFFFLVLRGCPGQLARTSTNPTGPEVNDHVSLQWPSYE